MNVELVEFTNQRGLIVTPLILQHWNSTSVFYLHNWKLPNQVWKKEINGLSKLIWQKHFFLFFFFYSVLDKVHVYVSPMSFLLLNSLMLMLVIFTEVRASCKGLWSGWFVGVAFHSSANSSGYFMIRCTGLMSREPMSSKLGFPLKNYIEWSKH